MIREGYYLWQSPFISFSFHKEARVALLCLPRGALARLHAEQVRTVHEYDKGGDSEPEVSNADLTVPDGAVRLRVAIVDRAGAASVTLPLN